MDKLMNSEKVVACGMAGRLPESDNLEELWNHLINKEDMLSTDDRKWDTEFHRLPKGSGMVKSLARFDANFFGVLPKQVEKTDPQLRILLEVTFEAIVDAGFKPRELKGSKTGVYIASSYFEAGIAYTNDLESKDGYAFQSCIPALLANRVSYFFDFKGPSYVSCAGCASGLLVLDNAIKDLMIGKCDYAVVGGTVAHLRPQLPFTMKHLQVLSVDGVTRPFDKSADGFGRAEAFVAVFITKESLCRRAYGQIMNAVSTHGGFMQEGVSFPSFDAQTALLKKAYSESAISPDDVEFIECHGTGTPTGDPIETNALHNVFCGNRTRDNPLLIGSIKSNMGHAECVAGLVGLVKSLLIINRGVIPPNLHFTDPNPSIVGLGDGTLKVVTEPTVYMGRPIGINSFGFGGVNAHVIVGPYTVPAQIYPCVIPRIILSSGRTKEGVNENLNYLAANVENGPFYNLAAQVADLPVESMPYRGYKIVKSGNRIEDTQSIDRAESRPHWFIFTGMGPQWPGMGKDLMVLETFKKTIFRCHDILEAIDPDIKLVELIMTSTKEQINQTISAYVAITSIQIALVNCLKDLGIHPDGILGHSFGETACAYADGILTDEQAIKAIYWRGRCILDSNPPPGCMVSVGLGWEETKARIPEGAVAACQNAEKNTTISGNTEVIENFVSILKSEGVIARKVNTNGIAFHSPDMLSAAPALQNELDKIITNRTPLSERWISTSVPDEAKQENLFTSSYLVNNLVSPVRFYEAVRKIPSGAVVIEIGPHGLFAGLLKSTLPSDCKYIALMSRKEEDNLHYFLSSVGKLFAFGHFVDLTKLYPPIKYPLGTGTPMVSPGIRWDHSAKWFVPKWEHFNIGGSSDRSVTKRVIDVGDGGQDEFIKHHYIDGRILYPATGYVVIAWQAIARMLKTVPEKLSIGFNDITIHRATVLSNTEKTTLEIRIVPSLNFFEISEHDEVTVTGKYNIPEKPFVPSHQPSRVDDSCFILTREDIYKELRLLGYHYGKRFQGITRSTADGHEATVVWNDNWITFLDSMLQVTVLGIDNPGRNLYLPTRVRSLRINPEYHMKLIAKRPYGAGMPVTVDRVLNKCYSGGVEIAGLHTSIAPRRQIKHTPTLEFVEFVPYGKMNISPTRDILEYGKACKEYIHCVSSKFSSTYQNRLLEDEEKNTQYETLINMKITPYIADDKFGYMKVLHEINKFKANNDIVKNVWNIVHTHALQLANDELLSFLFKSNTLKPLLDIVWENSTTRKLNVVELGALCGGLFIHIIPCMLSQPLLQLEFTATDFDVNELSKAFETQLKTLNVKAARYDVNGEEKYGFNHVDLVTVRGLAQQSSNVCKSLHNIHSMLNNGGFLMLHEFTSNFDMHLKFDELVCHTSNKRSHHPNRSSHLSCKEWNEIIHSSGFELIQQVSDGLISTLFLCRKRKQEASENKPIFITVSENSYNWVEDVKNELNQHNISTIWLVSDDDYKSGIVGMVNCLRQEDGGDKIRCIFNIDSKSQMSDASLLKNVIQTDLVMNVFKKGTWGSYRHQFVDKDGSIMTTQNAYVDVLTRGDLSSLQWIQSPATTTLNDPDHIPCTVNHSALNFKDVMLASGKLSTETAPGVTDTQLMEKSLKRVVRSAIMYQNIITFTKHWWIQEGNGFPMMIAKCIKDIVQQMDELGHQECVIGLEFSGRDPQGKRVMGIVANLGLATHVSVPAHLLFDVPESWSLEDAATVPIVYSTVYYALVVRGQIKRGESILIHSGSGGVGQAAIAVALSYGCQVYTTVGTKEKQNFLMKKFPTLSASCFASSRDVSFESHVMKQTNGVGVNLVLNSLAGEMFQASLMCLAKFGRFLEIGKYDLSQNSQIGTAIFLNNCVFHGIFLDGLFAKGASEWSIVSDLMKEGVRDGVVQPLSRTVFACDEVEKAFRYMAQGKHIGKVLIEVSQEEEVDKLPRRSLSAKVRSNCHPDKVYIMIGGLGGFGLEIAEWLVSRGCKKLVFTSRSGIRSGYQTRCVNRWKNLGVMINISKADASETNQCYELLRQSQNMGPIGGIFNLAMVLKDGLIENLTAEDFIKVCKPKLEVAHNLDQVTRQLCGSEMEWFVMFSSVSSGRGNGGQSNYGYANSAMERICERRKEEKLPGLAIQWGVVGDVGVVADSEIGNDTVIVGCSAQKLPSCLSTLDLFLSSTYPVLSTLVKFCPDEAEEKSSKVDITQFVSKFFGIEDIYSVSQDVSLADLGLDSIMAVEVQQKLEREFSASYSMKEVRALTLGKLLNDLGDQPVEKIKEDDNRNDLTVVTHLPSMSPILSSESKECLVQLNVGTNENLPVFLIHAMEGSVDVFRPLASKLLKHPVYGVQFISEVPNDSVSSIAKYYLSKMRTVQPNGPYNIAGYSFGSVVALEIASLIKNEKSSKSKTKLMLLDGSPSYATGRVRFVIERKYPFDKEETNALGPRGTLEAQTLIYLIQLFTNAPFHEIKQKLLAKSTYQERLDLAVSKIMPVVTHANLEDMVFSVDSHVKRILALMKYQPKSTWEMDMVLLKAKSCNKELLERVGPTDYNLSKICSGEVKVHIIEGNHETIFQDPGVQEISSIMAKVFQR